MISMWDPRPVGAGSPSPAGSKFQAFSVHLDRVLARRSVGALLLVGAVVLPLFRQRGTPSWRTVWAEDGHIYTQQAVNAGPLRVMFRGYNGYLQLPPRLLALPTPFFSLRYLALYCSFVSVAVAAALAWGVYHWSKSWVGPRVLRVALASLVVLMPAMGLDSTATITNLIWPFLAALPWALISREETASDVVTRSVVVVLAATSSLLAVCFLPLALGWLAYRRTRAALCVTSAFVVGLILQVTAASVTTTPANPLVAHRSLSNLVNIAEGEGGHVFGTFLFGTRWEMDLGNVSGAVAVVVPTVIVAAVLILLAIGADRRAQMAGAALVATALVVFASTAWERGPGVYGLNAGTFAVNPRYSVPSVMLLASAMTVLVSSRGSFVRESLREAGKYLFCVQTIVVVAVCFSVVSLRGADPPWLGRVDHVVAECATRPGSALATVPNQTKNLPVVAPSPNGLFPVTVPCRNLE